MLKTIYYCISSNLISGAEKRVIKLSLSNKHKNNTFLILNKSLFLEGLRNSELNRLLNSNLNKIIVLKDTPLLLRRIEKIWYLFQIIVSKKVVFQQQNFIHAYLGMGVVVLPLTLFPIRVIYEITSPDLADGFLKSYKRRKFFYRRLTSILCVTESVYNRIKFKSPGLFRELDNIKFMDSPYTKIEGANFVDFSQKENLIVYASRFIERKNVVFFAKVIKSVFSGIHDWRAMILGKGPLESQLREILKDEISSGRVEILYTPKIIDVFLRSKITVSLIEPDNYPSQAVFEAMACGNAIIVSDGTLSYKFIEGGNGLLTSKEKVLDGLVTLLNNDERIRDFMVKSKRYYDQNFSEENYFNELFGLYQ